MEELEDKKKYFYNLEQPEQLNQNKIVKSDKRTELLYGNWRKTFRRTTANEVAQLIENTTINQNSLIRITGSYSTKLLANLKINSTLQNGIEKRPTKTFFNKKPDIYQAINNHKLSFIPFSFNYINSLMTKEEDKLYLNNLSIVDNHLYFTIFIDRTRIINAKCTYIQTIDILTSKKRLTKTQNLNIIMTEQINAKDVLNTLVNLWNEEEFIFITKNEDNDLMCLSIFQDGKISHFSKENLMKLNDKIIIQKNKDLYETAKSKYEFTRKIIGKKPPIEDKQ